MESPSTDLDKSQSKNRKEDSGQETPNHSSTWPSPDSPLFDPFNMENDHINQPFSRNEESTSVINNTEPSTEACSSQTSQYRIPSSVFASKPSQGEWSITSNESLFSIRVDNVSFKNDQSLIWRSGELGSPWGQDKDKPSTPGHMFSYSEHQGRICSESIRECKMLSEATMKEVLRENESNDLLNNQPMSPSFTIPSRSSHGSSMSATSYALAMKTGDSERGGVLGTPGSIPEQSPPPPQVMTKPPEKEESPANCDRKPDRENEVGPTKKWFSFFPCCSSR